MTDTPFRDVVVVCQDDSCGNAGHPITLTIPDDVDAIVCGVCGSTLHERP